MEKILENYSDVGTCGTVLYSSMSKAGDLYYDKDYTQLVPVEDINELFLKGIIISHNMVDGEDSEPILIKPYTVTPDIDGMYKVLGFLMLDSPFTWSVRPRE